jgi:RHS repeat-associated protein
MFVDILDFAFPGPRALRWQRHYNSRRSASKGELGHGWAHDYGWRIRDNKRNSTELLDDQNRLQRFDKVKPDGEARVNPLGWKLRRDGDGFVLSTPDGLRRDFGGEQGGYHHLVRERDRNGNAITIERDNDGALLRLWDSAGRPYAFDLDNEKRIRRVRVATEPSHQQWLTVAEYLYDDTGDLVCLIDAEGHRFRYAYSHHLMVQHELPTGLSYCYRYDGISEDAYCVESWGEYVGRVDPALLSPLPIRPVGRDRRQVKGIHHVRLDYSKTLGYSEVVNGLGGSLRYFGDASGRVIKRVDEAGGVFEYHYDPVTGALTGETQPDGSTRILGASDAIQEQFVASDGVITSFLDGQGAEVTHDRRTGGAVFRRFDSRGNLEHLRHDDGTTEDFVSDTRGLLVRSVDRLGAVTTYVHDAAGNLIELARQGVGVEQMTYDYLGRKTQHVDVQGHATAWRWDNRNEVVEKRYADGGFTRWERDSLRMATRVDHNGEVSQVTYGGLHWPIRTEAPGGVVYEYRYDVMGNLLWVKNPRGDIAKQTYDYARRLIALDTFEEQRFEYIYDVAGRLVTKRTPLGIENRTFDDHGRLVEVELPDETVAIAYDGSKREVTIDNGSGLVRGLNAAGSQVRERSGIHELSIYWNGGHDDAFAADVGLPVRRTRNLAGEVSDITVGDDCRVEIGPISTRSANDPSIQPGRRLTRFGDHLIQRQSFNEVGQLVGISMSRATVGVPAADLGTSNDPGLLFWAQFTYRNDFLISESHSDGRAVEYELDATGRVEVRRELLRGQLLNEERLRYDAAGTPLFPGVAYDALGRPTGVDGDTLEYDVGGRLGRRTGPRGTTTYDWSAAGELLSVTTSDKIVRYRYDGTGRRIAKRVYRGNEIVRDISYVWTNNCVLYEVDHTAHRERTYVRDDKSFAPLGHVDVAGSETRACYYLKSPIGYPLVGFDESGSIVWRAHPSLYGVAQPSVAKVDVDGRYPNQHFDEDTGLVYNHRRWLDPRVGLFLSPDPLQLEGNLHPREYVRNPTIEADPSGLVPIVNGLDHGRTSTDLLRPGPNATAGTTAVPGFINAGANAQTRNFGVDTRRAIDNAGFTHGCHSCGSTDPDPTGAYGYKHFVPDHQPPISQTTAAGGTPAAGSVKLYPHCHRCSNAQRDQQNHLSNDPVANAAAGTANMATQVSNPAHPTPNRADLRTESTAIRNNAAAPPNNGWPNGF